MLSNCAKISSRLFHPEKPITRAEALYILDRVWNLGLTRVPFVKDKTDTVLGSSSVLTRAQAAVLIVNTLQKDIAQSTPPQPPASIESLFETMGGLL